MCIFKQGIQCFLLCSILIYFNVVDIVTVYICDKYMPADLSALHAPYFIPSKLMYLKIKKK